MTTQLASEAVILNAPLSFAGSWQRLLRLTKRITKGISRTWLRVAVQVAILYTIIPFVWAFIAVWYCTFGLLLVPYRLIRRGNRKSKRAALQHRELLDALQRRDA